MDDLKIKIYSRFKPFEWRRRLVEKMRACRTSEAFYRLKFLYIFTT